MERIHSGVHIATVIKLAFLVCLVISITTILCHQSLVYPNDDGIGFSHEHLILFRPGNGNGNGNSNGNGNGNVNANARKFTPCPEDFCKLVWFQGSPSHKLYEPVYRAFHAKGYSRTTNASRAHFLWMDQPNDPGDFYETLRPWQRYNQLPNTHKWDDKDEMVLVMNRYYSNSNSNSNSNREPNTISKPPQHLHSFPESYVLHLPDGLEAFRTRLSAEHGGMDVPWVLKEPTVNQGKGIAILPPQSEELKGIVDLVRNRIHAEGAKNSNNSNHTDQTQPRHGAMERLVVQKYICDEMTYGGRKFDVRVYWAVASVDPLLVLYHTEQNYVRIGHALYDESSLGSGNSTTKDHLTTHTFGSTETKATWDEFREFIETHVFGSDSKHKYRFYKENYIHNHHGNNNSKQTQNTATGILQTIEAIRNDPFAHVQNQMKTVIGHLADAYQNITFHGRSMAAENGFSWHAADMIIDNNLDVYIIEGTDGPGKDEDYDFRIRMHDELLGSLVDVLEEVVSRQEEGLPLDVSAMKEKGVLGGYEVVYDDGWFMDYRFQRLPPKKCIGSRSRNNNDIITNKSNISHTTTTLDKPMETKPSPPTRKIIPATFTALTKNYDNPTNGSPNNNNTNSNNKAVSKTFWMKSRTSRRYEPAARSLRRNGWIPVDSPEDAQLVYMVDTEFDFEQHNGENDDSPQSRPRRQQRQWVSQFPSQDSFFEGDHSKYLDATSSSGRVCRPIAYVGKLTRRLEVTVYWLVLSLDPLMVLFHDGFLFFPYSENDENEFLELSIEKGNGNREKKTDRVWKGSWKSFEFHLNRTHDFAVRFGKSKAAAAAAAIALDPMSHVRNQMKASLVKMARGFAKHSASEQPEKESTTTHYSSFAIFSSNFQIDRNLNVFAMDAYHSYVKGEEYEEIVTIHNDLYGSAFKLLLEYGYRNRNQAETPARQLHGEEILGNYEWLIRPDATASKRKPWKFRYDWKHKAQECFGVG